MLESNFKCRICGNDINNKLFNVKEMMFGTRKEFEYFECSSCLCLQISNIPENVGQYYPSNYYSFNKSNVETRSFLYKLLKFIIGKIYVFGKIKSQDNILLRKFGLLFLEKITRAEVNFNSKILDVGSGSGEKLQFLAAIGFKDLTGIDPFIEKDVFYKNGVKIYKKDISKIEQQFDMIMLNHSFEHMDNPEETFKEINRLLKPGAIALIRIPVADSFAWEKYGTNWVNLDAPRHFYLHTPQSIKHLADKTDFIIEDIFYDSDEGQFWISEQYSKDIPMFNKHSYYKDKLTITKQQMDNYKTKTKILNKKNNGDKASFYLRRK